MTATRRSDHYARAMASYGVYLAVCGFEYHGPKGHIGFAPKLTPENFKCAFTSAEGWGSFAQKSEGGSQKAEIAVCWGKLKLKTLALEMKNGNSVQVSLAGKSLPASSSFDGKRLVITLKDIVEIREGTKLELTVA